MGTLEIFLSEPVHTRQLEKTVVTVNGAPANSTITVTLAQIQGRKPFWGPESITVKADAAGSAFASFDVYLEGPTPVATLQSTATDTADSAYLPDGHAVEVLP